MSTTMKSLTVNLLAKIILAMAAVAGMATGPQEAAADGGAGTPKTRRVLYNLDGDSCMSTKKGSCPAQVTADDLKTVVEEITYPGSLVDTLLVCINAQCTYYPSKIGDMRGTLLPAAERAKWDPLEQQRFRNMEAMYAQGVEPYALLLAEAKRRGLETLLSYRMNDAHGLDFLYCKLWKEHPEYRLGAGLNFDHEAVRDYTFQLIKEATQRFDCDGIEMDFVRFPTFFKQGSESERIAKINDLMHRVRQMLDVEGEKKGRRLVLAARVPTSYQECRMIGLDPVTWADKHWIDFLTVSEFLVMRSDMSVKPWKELIKGVPIYASIEVVDGDAPKSNPSMTAARYREIAKHLWSDGADGIYLFNFFCPREGGREPPFAVLKDLGNPTLMRCR